MGIKIIIYIHVSSVCMSKNVYDAKLRNQETFFKSRALEYFHLLVRTLSHKKVVAIMIQFKPLPLNPVTMVRESGSRNNGKRERKWDKNVKCWLHGWVIVITLFIVICYSWVQITHHRQSREKIYKTTGTWHHWPYKKWKVKKSWTFSEQSCFFKKNLLTKHGTNLITM